MLTERKKMVKLNNRLLRYAAIATMGTAAITSPTITAKAGEGDKDWGIINVSVCNMRTSGDYDAGMATQGLLGMPVRIMNDDSWLEVETPDGYVSWVHPRSVYRVSRQQLTEWNSEKQVVITATFALVYSQPNKNSQTISDIVATNRLKLVGSLGAYYKVLFPDGRIGYLLKHDAQPIEQWRKNLHNDVSSILNTAKTMIGFPYMWGGMSTKGMDCSGFVRTVLMMHDIIIPRDASQMARKGQHLEIESDFSNLQPGDLLFFGSKATMTDSARVSHVAIYLGNKQFIHSLGMVQIASLDPDAPDYDEYDRNRLLWAQRVLPYINKIPGLFTTDNCEYYK